MSATRGRVDHFIHGAWVRANRSMPVVTPHDNRIIGSIAAGDARGRWTTRCERRGMGSRCGARRAVGSGRACCERSREGSKRKDALAALETRGHRKLIEESAWDVEDASACFDYYADRCEEMFGDRSYAEEEVKLPMDEFSGRLRREALGVVGLITPWNYPLLMATWKVAPALASGCAVVLKPSELASLTCQILGDVCVEAGLPPVRVQRRHGEGKRLARRSARIAAWIRYRSRDLWRRDASSCGRAPRM